MKSIHIEYQLDNLDNYPLSVINNIRNILISLNKSYGKDRNIEDDLGGYVVIVENIVDIEMLKESKLKGLVAEYTDVIECSEGANWTSSLFLLSSDFSIVVVTPEELSKFLLK